MDDHIPYLRLCKKRNLNVQLVLPKHTPPNQKGGLHCLRLISMKIDINTDYFSNNKKLKY